LRCGVQAFDLAGSITPESSGSEFTLHGGEQHGNKMIIGLEALVIPVRTMLMGCPINKASVDERENLLENGLS